MQMGWEIQETTKAHFKRAGRDAEFYRLALEAPAQLICLSERTKIISLDHHAPATSQRPAALHLKVREIHHQRKVRAEGPVPTYHAANAIEGD